jgi:hypothetical protein
MMGVVSAVQTAIGAERAKQSKEEHAVTTTQSTALTQSSDPIAEIRSTRDTAEKIANEGATEGTDVARLLGGLIAHLAEQVEKLASGSLAPASSRDQAAEGSGTQIAEPDEDEAVGPSDTSGAPVSGADRGQG